MQQELEAMRKALVLRNYATRTVDTYVSSLRRYLEQLKKPIEDVMPTDIQEWQFSRSARKYPGRCSTKRSAPSNSISSAFAIANGPSNSSPFNAHADRFRSN